MGATGTYTAKVVHCPRRHLRYDGDGFTGHHAGVGLYSTPQLDGPCAVTVRHAVGTGGLMVYNPLLVIVPVFVFSL